MINEVINSIIEAEKRAEGIVAAALGRSKDIILEAEAKKLSVTQAVKGKIKSQVKEILDAGDAEAAKAAIEVVNKGEAAAEALIAEGKAKSGEAANYIVRRIISKYGAR